MAERDDALDILKKIAEAGDQTSAAKPLNPKDSVGVRKVPHSVIPRTVLAELGLAMLEGARKYGRHNYRAAGIVASVNFDAAMRHLDDWWEGQDNDPESGANLSHITKAIAALCVLRDGMIQGNWVDDRPPASPVGWLQELNGKAATIIDRFKDAAQAFTQKTTPTNKRTP